VAVADGVGGFGGSDAVGEARGRVAASTHVSESEYRGAILGRNLFDATKIGTKDADCADTPEGCPPEEESTLELAAMLTGTLVSDVPAYSAAFIVEDGKTSAMAYGIGQKLKDAELVEIRDDRVRFRRGTDEQWLILGQKSGEGKPASTVASADPGAAGEGGITKNSETSFAIDRSLWEAKLQDLTSLSREARPLLHRGPDGNYDGYRLSAIRRGSLADQLGIKNGDIIHSVNGTPIDSVDAAMRAFDELRSGSSFKLEVTRRGQPVSLDYAVK
jgi:general secretion pathway protein C